MPEDSRQVYATQRLTVSKTVDVPAKYAFEWLTDYRADDGRLSRSRPSYKVFRMPGNKVVRIRSTRRGVTPPGLAIELIRLKPPFAWHVDQIDEHDLETVDYRITRLGARKSRITLDIVERWMTPKHPTLPEVRKGTGGVWDKIGAQLLESYRKGQPARGM